MSTNSSLDQDLGILALTFYMPKLYVAQTSLEKAHNCSGKYTKGLCQNAMSFITDREDPCSIALTVVSNLFKEYKNISKDDIEYIHVASESIIDHSKSVKSGLMRLFKNKNIEGCDIKHACYAGTQGLFNSIALIQNWYLRNNGRSQNKYALLVCTDIAEYGEQNTIPTGGCGAIACVIGRGGVIGLNNIRSQYSDNFYDFYKPNLASPYPVVNGHRSNELFIGSIDECYEDLSTKYSQYGNTKFRFNRFKYWIFHSPYNKLVQKAFGRILYNDYLKNENDDIYSSIEKENYYIKNPNGKQLNKILKQWQIFSKNYYKNMADDTTLLSKNIGNVYTATIFFGLISLLINKYKDNTLDKLQGEKVGCFSYGSGVCSSIFSLDISTKNLKLLSQISKTLSDRYDYYVKNRINIDYNTFMQIHRQREEMYKLDIKEGYTPIHNLKYIWDNSYCITNISENKVRDYYLLEEAINIEPQQHVKINNKSNSSKVHQVPPVQNNIHQNSKNVQTQNIDNNKIQNSRREENLSRKITLIGVLLPVLCSVAYIGHRFGDTIFGERN